MSQKRHNALAWLDDSLAELDDRGLRRTLTIRRGAQSARIVLDGKELINFSSNDYLGLASDERLIKAARTASEREGWGSGASPLVSGRSESHAELERRIAEFEGTESALVFPSGFAANAGTIPALVDEGDAIFADAKNHASLIDGCRLSNATRFVFPHRDCDALERQLRGASHFRRRLIVTDTLFSMGGDLAPIERIARLAAEYDAMLLVDEAHATGVYGANGRGVSESSTISPDLHEAIIIRIGTLSKALGSGGGFVCGTGPLINWLANRARSYVFSTAQPPATCAAAIAALDIVKQEPQRRERLLHAAAELRRNLHAQGWNTGNSQSQIIPIILSDPDQTMRIADNLRDRGFFVPGIRPPSVPQGESLLRLSLCYHHTPEMIADLTKTLAKLR